MLSVRDSVQRTGCPSRCASQQTSSSSGPKCALTPKPPPTSGAIDAELAGLQAERAGEAELVLVRRLRREPRGQAAVFADLGRRGADSSGQAPCAD